MRTRSRISRHKLPLCRATGLDRYRDRHQARQGAAALSASAERVKWAVFACPDCRGFHLEGLRQQDPSPFEPAPDGSPAIATHPRRYVLVDIENLTAGRATRSEARALWHFLAREALGITANDHIVIGGSRYVARKFATSIAGGNIKWVVGAQSPDGADRALLAASNPRQIAKHFDELVIMSGDHAFAGLASRAKGLGLRVHVITTTRPDQRNALSRQLSAAADQHTTARVHSDPLAPMARQKPPDHALRHRKEVIA